MPSPILVVPQPVMLSWSPEPVRPSDAASAPVALFDSGVGGLTVLRAFADLRPQESTYYVADQAHVPYGTRPLAEIETFAAGLTAHAFVAGAKMVIMACNVSSATFAPLAAQIYGEDRIVGVVEAGARGALEQTRNGRIGVLATLGTVQSRAYPEALLRLDAHLHVSQVACPRFVPLVEAGAVDTSEAEDAVREAIAPLEAARVDTVVLGCTHYPFLLGCLQRLAPHLRFIDPARRTAEEAATKLGPRTAPTEQEAVRTFLTTGDPGQFQKQAQALGPCRFHLRHGCHRLLWSPSLAA